MIYSEIHPYRYNVHFVREIVELELHLSSISFSIVVLLKAHSVEYRKMISPSANTFPKRAVIKKMYALYNVKDFGLYVRHIGIAGRHAKLSIKLLRLYFTIMLRTYTIHLGLPTNYLRNGSFLRETLKIINLQAKTSATPGRRPRFQIWNRRLILYTMYTKLLLYYSGVNIFCFCFVTRIAN